MRNVAYGVAQGVIDFKCRVCGERTPVEFDTGRVPLEVLWFLDCEHCGAMHTVTHERVLKVLAEPLEAEGGDNAQDRVRG